MNPAYRESGFSMIELMISVAMGLFMVAAILVAYVSSAQNFRVQQAMSEVQEDGRFASIQLLHDIRQSGLGRATGDAKVLGYDRIAADIQAVNALAVNLSGDQNHSATLAFNSIVSAVVFFPIVGDVGAAYYIGQPAGVAVPSLYRNREAIVEGVESLQFEFGLDTNNDGIVDQYKFQPQMNSQDWEDTQSVRFHLLVASRALNIVDDPQALPAPFGQVNTADRRLYRVYVGTASIRNARSALANAG